MSVSLRLSIVGKRNRPIYRIVVSETRYKRNGKSLDQLGVYNPNVNPPVFQIDRKKLDEWTKKGAIVSAGLYKLLKANNIVLSK
ncbi:30S ribosomal protein S16 [Patescibacteria group bacterium]|nr:30S ribosomal protein S16 [Patescibacteria group bacterium]